MVSNCRAINERENYARELGKYIDVDVYGQCGNNSCRRDEVNWNSNLILIYLIYLITISGHSRQGLKCRLCKINVHTDCKDGVGRCLPKSRLLRRKKSSSEIEARTDYVDGDDGNVDEPDTRVLDQTYMVLKQAGELGQGSVSTLRRYAAMEMERHAASATNPSATSASSGGSNLTQDGGNFGGNFGGSSGAINRPVSTRNSSLTGHPPTLAAKSIQNPNSLSVGLPSSFHPSSSGD